LQFPGKDANKNIHGMRLPFLRMPAPVLGSNCRTERAFCESPAEPYRQASKHTRYSGARVKGHQKTQRERRRDTFLVRGRQRMQIFLTAGEATSACENAGLHFLIHFVSNRDVLDFSG